MNYSYPQFVASGSADRIIDVLTDQQHTRPHQTVAGAVAASAVAVGFCPEAGQQAVESLGVGPHTVVGRLRRTELIQLAKVIHRYWRQSVGEGSSASQAR